MSFFFFFNDTATTEIYTLSLHDALPILLHRTSPIPIAAGEALYTAFDFNRLLERRAVDVVQPDLSLCGGFWQGRRIADLRELHHVRLSPPVWGSGVGLAAALHYVSSRAPHPHSTNAPDRKSTRL